MYAKLPWLWNSKGAENSWSLAILFNFLTRYFAFWFATSGIMFETRKLINQPIMDNTTDLVP